MSNAEGTHNNKYNSHDSQSSSWTTAEQETNAEEEEGNDVAAALEASLTVNDGDDDSWHRRRQHLDPVVVRRRVLRRYYALSTLAVSWTCTCPQTTDGLWTVLRLLVVYAFTLWFLTFRLQGTDPGYLTADVMRRLEDWEQRQREEASARGGDEEEGQRHAVDTTANVVVTPENSISSPPPTTEEKESREASEDTGQRALLTSDHSHHRQDDDAAPYEHRSATRRPPCRHCPSNLPPPPLRSHHCHKCQRHVATFDHHCDFIGTCIGEANHARFWLFLTLQAYGLMRCAVTVDSSPSGLLTRAFAHDDDSSSSMWTADLYVTACRVYVYALVTGAVLMWALHTLWACTNGTTLECAKGPRHLEYLHPSTRPCDFPFAQWRVDRTLLHWMRRDAGLCGWWRCCCCWRRTAKDVPPWRPTVWHRPGLIERDSEKWWEHPFQNKYYSCC